jgi:hypothetical protein
MYIIFEILIVPTKIYTNIMAWSWYYIYILLILNNCIFNLYNVLHHSMSEYDYSQVNQTPRPKIGIIIFWHFVWCVYKIIISDERMFRAKLIFVLAVRITLKIDVVIGTIAGAYR